jgi:hypothetical protein
MQKELISASGGSIYFCIQSEAYVMDTNINAVHNAPHHQNYHCHAPQVEGVDSLNNIAIM